MDFETNGDVMSLLETLLSEHDRDDQNVEKRKSQNSLLAGGASTQTIILRHRQF